MSLDVNPLVHEPTDRCSNLHCHSHNVDEPGRGYIICTECGHLYPTRWHLWWRRVREMAPTLWGDRPSRWRHLRAHHLPAIELASLGLLGPIKPPTWPDWFWNLLRLPFRRPSRISFCQECSHDF